MIYTFNYSNTFERFYGTKQLGEYETVQYLHGSAEGKNIVLGISDLNDELKQYKIYDFVKTFQKIINRTDYDFLQNSDISFQTLTLKNKHREFYEILVWGHSLDISDAEYIKEIFNLNTETHLNHTRLEIWYHNEPHAYLANLMNIMGKEIIQNWAKNKWLRLLTHSPDVALLNDLYKK